jgi:hypothetical protein
MEASMEGGEGTHCCWKLAEKSQSWQQPPPEEQ